MEMNILDDIIDKDGGIHYAELLPGVSRAGQDMMIRDFSRKMARKAKLKNIDFNAVELEKMIRNLPEQAQDAWMLSADKARIDFDNDLFKPSSLNPVTDRITIVDNVDPYNSRPGAVIHEVGHYTDHNLKSSKRRFIGKERNGEKLRIKVPQSQLSNLGKDIAEDYEKLSPPVDYRQASHPSLSSIRSIPTYENNKSIIRKNFPEITDERDIERYAKILQDWHELNPKYGIFLGDGYERKTYGHGPQYRNQKKQIAENSLEYMDFYTPEEKRLMKDLDAYNKKMIQLYKEGKDPIKVIGLPPDVTPLNDAMIKRDDAVSHAALSTEGLAEMYELLGYPSGQKFLETNMPKSYSNFSGIVDEDYRRARFVPKRRYANEDGLRLIEERERKLAERKAHADARNEYLYNAIPEDKRAYYENANPGDVLWYSYPGYEENRFPIFKDDPSYNLIGSSIVKYGRVPKGGWGSNFPGPGKFYRHSIEKIDLNNLRPDLANVPMNEDELLLIPEEQAEVLKKIESRRKK